MLKNYILVNLFVYFKDLKYDPIPGYQGVNRSITSENIYGLTYSNSRKNADDLLKTINKEKAEQLQKISAVKFY